MTGTFPQAKFNFMAGVGGFEVLNFILYNIDSGSKQVAVLGVFADIIGNESAIRNHFIFRFADVVEGFLSK